MVYENCIDQPLNIEAGAHYRSRCIQQSQQRREWGPSYLKQGNVHTTPTTRQNVFTTNDHKVKSGRTYIRHLVCKMTSTIHLRIKRKNTTQKNTTQKRAEQKNERRKHKSTPCNVTGRNRTARTTEPLTSTVCSENELKANESILWPNTRENAQSHGGMNKIDKESSINGLIDGLKGLKKYSADVTVRQKHKAWGGKYIVR